MTVEYDPLSPGRYRQHVEKWPAECLLRVKGGIAAPGDASDRIPVFRWAQTRGTGAGSRAEAPLARNPAATVVSLV